MNFINEIEDEETKMAVYISIANDLLAEDRKKETIKLIKFINNRIMKGRVREATDMGTVYDEQMIEELYNKNL